MKIVMNRTYSSIKGTFIRGKEYEIADAKFAQSILDKGYAVAIKTARSKPKETANKKVEKETR